MSSDTNEQQQTADISNLQESFLQQQEKISALKELVRKSGAAHGSSKTAAQEKVKNIAERLMKSKAKSRQGLNMSTYSTEATSHEASLGYEEKPSFLNISQASPMPHHSSTPNPTPNPTPNRPQMQTSAFSTSGSEKIALMRQQLEQNKLRMAQKASSKQHLEQLVSQLKEKFDSTQQCLEDTSELGRSMSDLSNLMIYTPVSRERHKSATDLSTQNFSLERERIKFLENRCRLLEKQLEKEKLNNNRTANLSHSAQDSDNRIKELEIALAAKQNDFDKNEELHREEMSRLQSKLDNITDENRSAYESSENEALKDRIEQMAKENTRLMQEIEKLSSQSLHPSASGDSSEEKDKLLNEIEILKAKLEDHSVAEPSDFTELRSENELMQKEIDIQLKRIKELNEINDVLETARCDLTSKNIQLEEHIQQLQADVIVAQEKLRCSEEKCSQLQMNSKISEKPDTNSQIKSEMAKQIQELMDEVVELRCENKQLQESIRESEKVEINDSSIAEKVASLEATIESQREDLFKSQETLRKNEEELMEKTIELNVLSANFRALEEKYDSSNKTKPLFSSSSSAGNEDNNRELEMDNQQLKQKLDESNKAMIKLKLKCKQNEKQIEKLKKSSDLHKEVAKLEKEKEELQQKIIELEDEKGQWQLTQMETSSSAAAQNCSHDSEFAEYEASIESLTNQLKEKEQQYNALKQGEQTRVTSELIEIQLEEEVKELNDEVKSLRTELQNKENALQTANEKIDAVQHQKDELDKKLEHYLNENIELLDKVEKLSKSSSSAESIEMVERLTHQEKQELEEFNKRLETGEVNEGSSQKYSVNELTQTEMNPELTESLNKLREESSELMSKIELFTTERREVLEKMEHLNTENHELLQRIEDLTEEKREAESKLDEAKQRQDELSVSLKAANREKDSLAVQMAESRTYKDQLSQELTSLQQTSELVASLDNGETLFDKCEKSLSKLSCELEAYRKANDKKSKFNVSKKLAKEAENAHSQLSELLQKVKEASSAVETVTVVETVVAVTAPNGKALAEYEQLTAQNRELKATIVELRRLLDEARYNQDEQDDRRFSEEIPAIKSNIATDNEFEAKLKEAVLQIGGYENQLTELQSRVEDLTRELYDARQGNAEKTEEISKLAEEIVVLKKLSEDFDRVINDKEMAHEKQIEQVTRLRKELEAKCDTYEQEMEILQTLVTEQKQQLIEAYKEHEHETNVKLLALQQQEEQIRQLKQEIVDLKETSAMVGSDLTQDLQNECEKLREALKINKNLVQQQLDELSNKQETIDTLNQQIIDLYKTMEDNSNKIIEKEDEIAYLQELHDTNKQQLQQLEQKQKDLEINNQQFKSSNQELQHQLEQLSQLEASHKQLINKNQELEQRNKDQLEKLKKYAANLKKKAQQCLEFESKLKVQQSLPVDTKANDELQSAIDKLQQQLEASKRQLLVKDEEILDLANITKTLEQEVKQLQLAIDEKQSSIQNLQVNLAGVQQHSSTMSSNAAAIDQLQQELLIHQEELMQRDQHIVELKQSLASSTQQLQADQNTIQKLESELTAVRQQTSDWDDSSETDQLREELICTQENLRLKVREIEELRQSLMAAHEQQTDWGNESSVKNADYENLSKVLADKSAKLEKAETSIGDLEDEIMILREKDHENEQKINELCNELQGAKKTQDLAGIESLRNELTTCEEKFKVTSEELKAKSLKFEKSKAVIKERNGQIQRLQGQLKDLQEKLSTQPEEEFISQTQTDASTIHQPSTVSEVETLKEAYNKLNDKYASEKSNFQQTITRLETLHDGIQAKLQEDMSYIETLEQENAKFKDKICRLEDCVACFEERRSSMERKANLMDAQLQSSTEEHLKAEDELIYRLNMLSNHDEVIAQRLIDSQSDKEEMEETFRKFQEDNNQLQTKYNKLEREYLEFKEETKTQYEQELSEQREKLSHAEAEAERQKSAYENKLAVKATELDELEVELSEQLDQVNSEKRELSEKLERLTDDCAVYQNDILRLQENLNTLEQAKTELERESSWLRMQSENSQQDLYDLQELRMQSMQDKTENDNLRHQIESLLSNHENELQALRTQIAELDSLRMQVGQNQTDDQVFIETENKRLTDLLAEKEQVIENYQRQNLQLQMAASAGGSNVGHQADPFALALGLPQQSTAAAVDHNEIQRLNHDLIERNAMVGRLQQDLNNLQAEFNVLLEANQEMKRLSQDRQQEVVNLQTLQSVASTLAASQPSDVIPAPPMFFSSSDSTMRSPFDDIIQSQNMEPSLQSTSEQPTIEDLQRNVSDLEKHANDLEHKLAIRNQREAEYDERLRGVENRLQEKELQLQQARQELQNIQAEHSKTLVQQTENMSLQTELETLRNLFRQLEGLLQEKDQELEKMRALLDEEHLKKNINTLESQIVSDPSVQPTLDMFFGNSAAQDFEPFVIPQTVAEPVVEEIIVPKRTYDCHPGDKLNMPTAVETDITSLDIGDSWGDSWGNNEAAAEAEHFAKQNLNTLNAAQPSLLARDQVLELQMQELNERLQELQLALERSEDQKKELHVKSGKLMKKLKEYKVKIDDLQSSANTADLRKSSSVESNSMFDDLLQEEMKSQIKSLELKLEEQLKQRENFNLEKDKLLKRIDVLTGGNERMAEMKERQDMEVQMYQARIRELQQKLESLDDWGNEESKSDEPQKPKSAQDLSVVQSIGQQDNLQQKIDTLTLEVQDLMGDRLELQALLEDEKVNSQRAEQTVVSLRQQLGQLAETQSSNDTTELNNLKIQLQNLQETYNSQLDTNRKLSADFQRQTEVLSLSQANELRLQSELDALKLEVENLRETLANTKQSLIDLEAELSSLKQLKEKQLDAAISCDIQQQSSNEIALLKSEKHQLEEHIQKLQQEVEVLKATLAKQHQLEEKLQQLQAENDYLKQAAGGNSNNGELAEQLQERESEIMHLKQRINDLMNEDHTEKLVLELLTKNQEIQMLKMQVKHLEDDKHELENNLSLQITKEMQVNKDDEEEDAQKLPINQSITYELELQVKELQEEKKQMEVELQVLNNHVLESLQQDDKMKALTLELDTKIIEISELRKTVEALQKGGGAPAAAETSVDFVKLNAQWETVVEQRCGEIATMWQDHLTQRERDFKIREDRLLEEVNALRANQSTSAINDSVQQIVSGATTASSTPVSESSTASGTTSAEASHDGTPLHIHRSQDNAANAEVIIEQMQNALESQEMEIVTLKEQLAIRSAEYARLAAQYDPFKLRDTSSHVGIVESRKQPVPQSNSDTAMVSKSELDLAMYMLHQRDMRCEEMTLELVSLLEERDTLQIKLSNTLRQVEAIRCQSKALADASSPEGSPSDLSANENTANTSVAGSTAGTGDEELNLKLSQLLTVNHSKDKVIKEEREQRSRQMETFQQDVAKMPSAAVSELIGTDLSQSNQSPSTLLLNWLWGNKSGNPGSSAPDF